MNGDSLTFSFFLGIETSLGPLIYSIWMNMDTDTGIGYLDFYFSCIYKKVIFSNKKQGTNIQGVTYYFILFF